ncbi:MAG: hypothetical protein HRT90_11405, partial [Candidatus Margulisbacteria bacterium]|nr:hypothetical protein [Candidatus Margulisiibacteriota bacterium]
MQYPIVHPIYQNTLVGMIILELDLFMKNFLHGGDISGSEKWMHDHEEIPHLLRQNREALQKVKIEINKMEGSIEKIQAEINRIKKEGPEKSIDEVGYTSESYDRYLSRLSVPREIYEKEAIKYHDAVERYNGLVDREKMLSQQLGYKEKITLEKLQKKYGYIDFHDVQRDFESLDDKKRKVVLKSEKDMEIKRLLKLDQEVAREEKEEDLTQHNVKAADHIYPFHLRGVGMSEDHWIHNFFAAYDEFQIITKCIIPVFDDKENRVHNFKKRIEFMGLKDLSDVMKCIKIAHNVGLNVRVVTTPQGGEAPERKHQDGDDETQNKPIEDMRYHCSALQKDMPWDEVGSDEKDTPIICLVNLGGRLVYASLREDDEEEAIMDIRSFEIRGEGDNEKIKMNYTAGFRIHGRQRKIEHYENLVVMDPGFDAHHNIDYMPEQKEKLRAYSEKHKKPHPSIKIINDIYMGIRKDIENNMGSFSPKIMRYLELFKVINSFVFILNSFKANGRVPILDPPAPDKYIPYNMPHSFPPVPVGVETKEEKDVPKVYRVIGGCGMRTENMESQKVEKFKRIWRDIHESAETKHDGAGNRNRYSWREVEGQKRYFFSVKTAPFSGTPQDAFENMIS